MNKKQNNSKPMTRRGWLSWLGRGAVGVALAGLGVRLLMGKETSHASETCDRKKVCRGCPWVSGCGRPEAMSYRDRHGEGGDE